MMSEEKARGVVKRKRSAIKSDASTSADLTRSAEADREVKRGMQQKLGSDARPRVASVHGFRLYLSPICFLVLMLTGC